MSDDRDRPAPLQPDELWDYCDKLRRDLKAVKVAIKISYDDGSRVIFECGPEPEREDD